MMRLAPVMTLAVLLVAAPALATNWCGENGVVRLSFMPGGELQAVHEADGSEKGVTMVDVYAYLTDFTPVQRKGEAFLGIGGLEMKLLIEGAEGFITSQEFPVANRSLGRKPGEIIAGFYPGIEVGTEPVELVHWTVLFQGTPENVVFRLDTADGLTAQRTDGLAGMGCSAYYTGMEQAGQLGDLFGAGGVSAYLNYEGEPDLQVRHSQLSWQQVGQYEAR